MGESNLSAGEKKALKDNPDSSIIFLDSHYETAIVSIVIQSPYEVSMAGYTGIKYEALKDYIKWMTPESYSVEEVTKDNMSMLLNLGQYYASQLNNRK